MIASVEMMLRLRTRLPVLVTSRPQASRCPRLAYRSAASAAAAGSSASDPNQIQVGPWPTRFSVSATTTIKAAPLNART
jgi:hypothetical protein